MRIPTTAIGVLAAGLLASGCQKATDEPGATAAPSLYPAGTPLWKQLPDKPAGPAPAPEAGTRRSFALRTIVTGLQGPNQLVARPGDDRLYVVEQGGTVRILDGRRVVSRPFVDLRRQTRSEGERGLLSLVFSPDGRTANVLLTDRRGDTRVLAIPAGRDRADTRRARVLLELDQPYENHNGGTLLVDERGRLVLGLGDGGSAFDPQQRAQDLDERLGKILRHDGRGWEVVASGLRNPFRMSFDRETGRLWLGDVGQDRIEEVDALFLPEEGAPTPNLGWAAYEGHLPVGRKQLAGHHRLTWPVTSYAHRDGHCSVTGGYVSRGRRLAALRGRYVFGDFCRGTIWSLDAAAAEEPARADLRREAARLPGLVSFGEDADGDLYAVSVQGTVAELIPTS
ncbi:MAG TPA: PQQ-dependent sugar dehydrogenase [Baekduia sp.]|nr:PQQ-dependent sugar dehydrogenase [Baekduia sp.]